MTSNYIELIEKIKSNLATAIYGKDECIDVLTIAIIAGGSVLIEDVPGVGKTTLAKALAQSLKAQFSRIQFTPDLLPTDITGSAMFLQNEGKFELARIAPGKYGVGLSDDSESGFVNELAEVEIPAGENVKIDIKCKSQML